MAATTTQSFPMAEAKQIVKDLFVPKPWIYWLDFSFSVILGWTAFILAVRTKNFSWLQIGFLITAGFALYRAVLFMHELSHLPKRSFRIFHWAWNLFCGFPLAIPSFLYLDVHTDHHKQRIYGTRYDPEYFPFALAKPYRIPLFLANMLIAPSFFLLRFLVLAPLSYFHLPLRKPLWVMGSSLAAGGDYRRPLPDKKQARAGFIQEFITFLYLTAALALMVFGILPWKVLAIWYAMGVFILLNNALRSLAAHCDRNPPDHVMTFEEQFLDSTDIPGNPVLTPLWAPVGIRYHATHHLFPGIPYHSLGEAHRRLMRSLPEGSPYPLAYRKSLWQALSLLWKEACANSAKASTKAKTDH